MSNRTACIKLTDVKSYRAVAFWVTSWRIVTTMNWTQKVITLTGCCSTSSFLMNNNPDDERGTRLGFVGLGVVSINHLVNITELHTSAPNRWPSNISYCLFPQQASNTRHRDNCFIICAPLQRQTNDQMLCFHKGMFVDHKSRLRQFFTNYPVLVTILKAFTNA